MNERFGRFIGGALQGYTGNWLWWLLPSAGVCSLAWIGKWLVWLLLLRVEIGAVLLVFTFTLALATWRKHQVAGQKQHAAAISNPGPKLAPGLIKRPGADVENQNPQVQLLDAQLADCHAQQKHLEENLAALAGELAAARGEAQRCSSYTTTLKTLLLSHSLPIPVPPPLPPAAILR